MKFSIHSIPHLLLLSYFLSPSPWALASTEALIPHHRNLRAQLQEVNIPLPTHLPCGIKKFQEVTYLFEDENRFGTKGLSRQTVSATRIETTDSSCLQNYGVVQFIKGCAYNSDLNPKTGEIEKWFGRSYEFNGKHLPFIHLDWEPDTLDADPLYWSGDANDRIGSYATPLAPFVFSSNPSDLWMKLVALNHLPEHFSTLDQLRAQNQTPQFPVLLTRDIPTNANFTFDSASNVSLQFQTCVYELKNIPLTGSPARPDIPTSEGGPIHCFEWSHNHVYNHKLKIFDELNEIDPYCFSPAAQQQLSNKK